MKQLTLVAGPSLLEEETRLLKLAEWMGVPTKTIRGGYDPASTPTLFGEAGGGALVMSAETLARAHKASPANLEPLSPERRGTLLVLGCTDHARHGGALSWLTGGRVRGMSVVEAPPTAETMVDLPRGGREFTRQLAGLRFSTARPRVGATFQRVDDTGGEAIVLVNGQPVFVRVAVGSYDVFLLAGSDVPDIDEPLPPGDGLEAHYDRLIPSLAFLRHRFGEMCWHGPESTARFIIDDPLLGEHYGFLDYRALLNSMERTGYGASIAFIPWNYRRTSNRTASRLFVPRSDLSICVHGCDHTDGEFEARDHTLLRRKASLALERMERHQTRTGLPFEPVMVFPQGRFSSDAMRALRGAGFLAAVNSTCFPADGDRNLLRIADFMRPAITRFHGFPVFHRRYPRRLVDSAFDLFLGKPALLVEHHEYFRDGYGRLEEYVAGLRRLEPSLAWPSLSTQLTRSCLMRLTSRDVVEVQFFTRRFRLENTGAARRTFRLAKHEPQASVIRAASVDGLDVPFEFKDDRVEIEVEVDPGQSRDIELLDHPLPLGSAIRLGPLHNARVLARRVLSEFRDNTLSRHPGLLRTATGLTRRLGVSGARQPARHPS